jgi:2-dehydropantoate 2-reductase
MTLTAVLTVPLKKKFKKTKAVKGQVEQQDHLNTIALLGVGAIGQLLSHQLCANGAKLRLLTRQESGDCTLELSELNPQEKPPSHQVPTSHVSTHLIAKHLKSSVSRIHCQALAYADIRPDNMADITLLIVTTKAYQVTQLIVPLLSKLNPNCHILLLHNGMGPHLDLAPHLAAYPNMGLSLGNTSQGAMRTSTWHVRHTGEGLTHLGHAYGTAMPDTYRQLLLQAIPNSHWQADIITSLWQKLAINCAINPLTAIHACENGALSAPPYQEIIKQLLTELIPVAKTQGVKLAFDDLLTKVNQVITLTAKNHSSMYQDITHQRPTEIAQINGFVVQSAKTHQLKTPTHQRLMNDINALQSR